MPDTTISDRLSQLLVSLCNEGWELYEPKKGRAAAPIDPHATHGSESIEHLTLRRTCLVLGVTYSQKIDELRFIPISNTLPPDAHRGVGLFDAVTKTHIIKPSYHGLVPLLVDAEAARLGLLDSTRFTLSDHTQMSDSAFLRSLYAQVIARDTADWLGTTLANVRKRIDEDDTTLEVIRTALYNAPDVLPDPVPMAAAIGITLDCWRHTEIEQLHATDKRLSDVIMAKLNITTTRRVRSYITSHGIDWMSVAGLLLDPERPAGEHTSIGELTGAHWPELAASIEQKLNYWQHVESVIGPRATLRLLSAVGSTDYTTRWWGNSWWPMLAGKVFDHVEKRFPQLLPEPVDEFSMMDLRSDVIYQPDELPDEVLAVLIDPPDGKGLRYGPVSKPKRHVLHLSEGV
jgi:hypothetical protein